MQPLHQKVLATRTSRCIILWLFGEGKSEHREATLRMAYREVSKIHGLRHMTQHFIIFLLSVFKVMLQWLGIRRMFPLLLYMFEESVTIYFHCIGFGCNAVCTWNSKRVLYDFEVIRIFSHFDFLLLCFIFWTLEIFKGQQWNFTDLYMLLI